ncbi:signal peptide protein [Streptomyces sp. AcH 505]|uniref:hypothetical protein n=1 Tax=Streptomyces sp. AcH 505 TaxID=352211 RepID=UPI0005922C8F|nr:signal peptide protein [Streptomyces sp. AcH 505]
MKTIGYVIATALTLAVAAPTLASAETVVIKRDRDYGAHAEMRMHRDHGWHRHHDRRVVVIKRHHRHW